MKLIPWHILLLWLLVLPLTACMPKLGEDNGPEYVKTYYIDVPRGFAIEYPSDWEKSRKSASGAVTWQPPPVKDDAADVMAAITSFSPLVVPGDEDIMLNHFAAAHPGFIITSKEQMDLPGAPSALRVRGHTPSRVILASFVITRKRAYILEFSASPQRFDEYQPVFENMAASFKILE